MRRAFERVLGYFGKRRADAEFEEEMAAHLALAEEELRASGLSEEEARRRARARFGGLDAMREEHRDERGLPWLDHLMQDLRYGVRSLRREPVFTAVVVGILALGLGANVAVFSVVDRLALSPLPFPQAERLMWFQPNEGKGGLSETTYTVAAFEEFQRHNRSFEQVTAFQTFYNSIRYKLSVAGGQPLPVSGVQVGGNFFETLGVRAAQGRLFAAEECLKGGRRVAVLGHAFWLRQYSGDAAILGRTITLNNEPVTVVGVLPEDFEFGTVFAPGMRVDFYEPAVMDFWRTWGNTLSIVGRLRPGVTREAAEQESMALFPRLRAQHADWWSDYKSQMVPLGERVSGRLRRSLIVLWSAVGLILLIVCVNLANLLVARSAARAREFAMRAALGAGRGRLARQLLTEGLLLASAGAALGLGLAWGILAALRQQTAVTLPLLETVRLDAAAAGWGLGLTLLVVLVLGLAPALQGGGAVTAEALKEGAAGSGQSRGSERVRGVLVVCEVALSCVLLVGAGLLLRSFSRVLEVDLGFEPARASVLEIDYEVRRGESRMAKLQPLLEAVRALPGVQAAGIVDMLPLDKNRSWGFRAKGRVYPKGDRSGSTIVYVATPGVLQAMGMRLSAGRDLSAGDVRGSEGVVVLNEAAARRHFPEGGAVGRIGLIGDYEVRVVGLVRDARESSPEAEASPQMFLSAGQVGPEGAELVVRSALPASVLAPMLKRAVLAWNPAQPATELRPLEQVVTRSVSARRFVAGLVGSFALAALVLAMLGIYGLIAYAVARRRREIGIRVALGASRWQVQSEVLGRTLRLAGMGLAVGAGGAYLVARGIASLLYATQPGDPPTFAAVGLLLAGVALVAGYLPARRAAAVAPMAALRTE